MPLRFDSKLVIDGIDQSRNIRDAFSVAAKEIKSGKIKKNVNVRRALTNNLRKLSDFLSGEGPGAIQGFFGEPKDKSKYSSAKAAPDVETDLRLLEQALGKDVASKLAIDTSVTDKSKRTVEIKQTASKSKQITFTGISVAGFEGVSTKGLDPLRRIDKTRDKLNLSSAKKDQKVIFNWLYGPGNLFRQALYRASFQKMQNLLTFVYVDPKGSLRQSVQVKAIPGFIKYIEQATRTQSEAEKYFIVEVRDDIFTLRTTPLFDALIDDKYIEVTTQIQKALVADFTQNLVDYFTKGKANTEIRKALGAKSQYSLIQVVAEILYIAAEFDPQYGGDPLEITFDKKAQSFGPVSQKAKRGRPKKRVLKDPIQEQISVQQIEALARRMFRAVMPKGIPGGPPPPRPEILTERTGRFAESFRITKFNQRKEFLEYTYDPIYKVFEGEQRAPSALIERHGLRPAIQQLVGRHFRFIRDKN